MTMMEFVLNVMLIFLETNETSVSFLLISTPHVRVNFRSVFSVDNNSIYRISKIQIHEIRDSDLCFSE